MVRRLTAAAVLAIGCAVAMGPPAATSGALPPPSGHPVDRAVGTVDGSPGEVTGALPGAGGTGSAPEPSDGVVPGRAGGPGTPIEDAVRQDARRFGWPLLLGLAVVVFLAFQGRVERHERKLADAPLDQGERLRFR